MAGSKQSADSACFERQQELTSELIIYSDPARQSCLHSIRHLPSSGRPRRKFRFQIFWLWLVRACTRRRSLLPLTQCPFRFMKHDINTVRGMSPANTLIALQLTFVDCLTGSIEWTQRNFIFLFIWSVRERCGARQLSPGGVLASHMAAAFRDTRCSPVATAWLWT